MWGLGGRWMAVRLGTIVIKRDHRRGYQGVADERWWWESRVGSRVEQRRDGGTMKETESKVGRWQKERGNMK